MKKVFTPENLDRVCGECVYFLAGAGCRKHASPTVRYHTEPIFCPDFVDVDEVMDR